MTNKIGGQVVWAHGHKLQEGATLNIEEKFFQKKNICSRLPRCDKKEIICHNLGRKCTHFLLCCGAIALQNPIKLVLHPHYLHNK